MNERALQELKEFILESTLQILESSTISTTSTTPTSKVGGQPAAEKEKKSSAENKQSPQDKRTAKVQKVLEKNPQASHAIGAAAKVGSFTPGKAEGILDMILVPYDNAAKSAGKPGISDNNVPAIVQGAKKAVARLAKKGALEKELQDLAAELGETGADPKGSPNGDPARSILKK